jgi:hypothetical protein
MRLLKSKLADLASAAILGAVAYGLTRVIVAII